MDWRLVKLVNRTPNFIVYHSKTKLYFGIKSVTSLEKLLKKHSNSNMVIITGKTSARKSGALDDVLSIIRSNEISYTLHDNIEPNPRLEHCEKIVEQEKESNVKSIVAIGGGSVLDTAKVVAAALGDEVDCRAFVEGSQRPLNPLPLYLVNLTHGTGSEIDRYAVINIPEKKLKKGFPILHADYSFDDPRYTVTLPKFQSIITTLDALYHSYESATGPRSNPFVIDLATNSVQRIAFFLSRVVNEPHNLRARYELLYSSMIAGISIDYAGTHIIHLVEHGLSGINERLEHAAGLAIVGPALIPYVHRSNPVASAWVLRSLDPRVKPLSSHDTKASNIVSFFQESVGFDRRLGDYGFDRKDVEEAVDVIWPLAIKYWGEKPFGIDKDSLKNLLYELL